MFFIVESKASRAPNPGGIILKITKSNDTEIQFSMRNGEHFESTSCKSFPRTHVKKIVFTVTEQHRIYEIDVIQQRRKSLIISDYQSVNPS